MYAKKSVSMKVVVLLLAVVLLIGCTVGGTLAWLIAQTNTVTNTFTVGNINIDLTETVGGTATSAKEAAVENKGFKIVPGVTESKNPTVIVEAKSENSFVFVKIEESNITVDNVTYVTWKIADGWTQLAGVSGVYYREYTADAEAIYPVLKDNQVSYPATLTKAQLDALGNEQPALIFTAYAVQKEGSNTAEEAWAKINNP